MTIALCERPHALTGYRAVLLTVALQQFPAELQPAYLFITRHMKQFKWKI